VQGVTGATGATEGATGPEGKTGATGATGPPGVERYANRIFAPNTEAIGEEHFGSGHLILEVPGIAKVTTRECFHGEAKVEVTSLNATTSRALSTVPEGSGLTLFNPADGPKPILTVEGPGWQPFTTREPASPPPQIPEFRIESGTGANTMIADFRVVAMGIGVASATECSFSATADVYKG
jgi:hypothetical protein